MKIAILEIAPTGHYTYVESIAKIYTAVAGNQAHIYTTEKGAKAMQHLENQAISVIETGAEKADLEHIAGQKYDKIFVVTLEAYAKEPYRIMCLFEKINFGCPLYYVMHNVDFWFKQSIADKFRNIFFNLKNIHDFVYQSKIYFKYVSINPSIIKKVEQSGGAFVTLSETVAAELKKYTQRVIEDLEPEKLAELKQSPELYALKLKSKVQDFMNNHAEEEFEKRITIGKIELKQSYNFPKTITLIRSMLGGNLGLYSKEEAVNSLESRLKGALEEMDNIVFWHRNISRRGFELNGNFNHYPDFIVYTQSKKIILIETKGEHLNADKKIKLGGFYTKYSSQQIHYFMLFENNPPTGAYDFDNVVNKVREM